MVAQYSVFGRQVGSHVLAMLVLGGAFGGSFAYSSMGKSKKEKNPAPPLNAGSEDEEKFIKEFIQATDMDSLKEGSAAKH